MTTVYVPRVIRRAEEAEALPVGTVATHPQHLPLQKWKPGLEDPIWGFYGADTEPEELVGWTALVPVEAEEERWEAGAIPDFLGITFRWSAARRYVTEWEDAR